MKKLVTAELMRKIDSYAIDDLGVKSISLMERAGKGVYDSIIKHENSLAGKKVVIFCGKGNNGGDGLVVAENILEYNDDVDLNVYVLCKKTEIKGDPKKIATRLTKSFKDIKFITVFKESYIEDADVVVDAIFGTGFNANPEGLFAEVIYAIKASKGTVYSVDIPSGIHGTTGNMEDVAVKADYTVTFGYPKVGLFINDGYTNSGKVEIADIGLPEECDNLIDSSLILTEESDIKGLIRDRELISDKKEFGKVFSFSGSLAAPGAAVMSSLAALRSGTGLLKLGIPMNVAAQITAVHPEIMTIPLQFVPPGYASLNSERDLLRGLRWSSVVLIGPGISVTNETKKVAKRLFLKVTDRPLVLDADALNIIAEVPDMFQRMDTELVITPHNSEMGRLVGTTKEFIILDRLSIVAEKAQAWNCHIVLKGTPTLIAEPDGTVHLHINKNPGMAVGGTGDVLSGIITSFLGQRYKMMEAINIALNIHSIAGRYARDKKGEHSMLPTDIIDEIPNAIKYLKSL